VPDNNNEAKDHESSKKGRGWRGDSAGHARAGRLGGLARSRSKNNNNPTPQQEEEQ